MSDSRGTRVYVGNLTDKVKKEDLEGEFTKYGKLNSVWVAFNPPGFAFVEFENRDEAEKACDILNGTEILGSQLRVEISKGRPRQGGRRNGSGGGGGGGGRFRDSGSSDFRRSRSGYRSGGSSGGFGGPRSSSGGGGGGFRSRGGPGGGSRYNENGYSGGGGRSSGGYSGGRDSGFSGSRDGGSRSYGSSSYGSGSGGRSGGGPGGRFRSRSPAGGRGRF